MPVTLAQMEKEGILAELVACFDDGTSAGTLLSKAGIEGGSFPPFGTPDIEGWWRSVSMKLEHGMGGRNRLERLLSSAADIYPGNQKFEPYRQDSSSPDKRNNNGGNITLRLPDTYPPEDVIRILDKLKEIALETGHNVEVNLGWSGSSSFSLSIPGIKSKEETERIAGRIEQALAEENIRAEVWIEPYHFRDYYSDPLTAEGPDGRRFAMDQIRASTPVGDVARGVMHHYSDDVWPVRKGQKTQAVVDQVTADGTSNRLDPRQTLHDAGVRPGDTLRVAPERTAGAIDIHLREAALARVRNEVLHFAETHPGFEVKANSLVAPTEYLFRFETKGFGPPPSRSRSPQIIDYHEVLVELPGDFPIKAPEAWWQTDIYHPNIDPDTGWVCLGALQKQYRPSLDFGELCQMLFDLAGYRNYAVTEGHNKEAARWALSPEGQLAIEEIGGISMIGRMVMEGTPERKIKIRKLSS